MTQEIEFEISPELAEAMQRVVAAVEQLYDALMDMVRKFMEAVRKSFATLMRLFTRVQLLEWRFPHRVADFLSRRIPPGSPSGLVCTG